MTYRTPPKIPPLLASSPPQSQTSFTLQLKILGRELDIEVLFSDNRHTLINRLCRLYDIPTEYSDVMYEKITASLNSIIKKDNISPSLLDKILGFFHKGPVYYDGEREMFGYEEIVEEQSQSKENKVQPAEIKDRTKKKVEPEQRSQEKSTTFKPRNAQSKILRQTLITNRPRITNIPTVLKRPLPISQNHRDFIMNPKKSYRAAHKRVQSYYCPNPANPKLPKNYLSSKTARVLPPHTRPQASSKLKLYSRPQNEEQPQKAKMYSSTDLSHNKRSSLCNLNVNPCSAQLHRPATHRRSYSSTHLQRRYKYLAEDQYPQQQSYCF